jgi:hypothetical protein
MEGMKAVHPSIRVSNRKKEKRDEWEEETLACTFTLLNYDDSLFSLFLFFLSHIPISPRDLNTSTTLAVYSLCLVNALVWCLVNGSGISISCSSGTHTQTRHIQPSERERIDRGGKRRIGTTKYL